jgi:hypothetical protein
MVMKRLYFILVLMAGIAFSGCQNNNSKTITSDVVKNSKSASGDVKNDMAKMAFVETVHDFGKVIRGEKVSYKFKFKNVGKSDLVITKVSTSCGCTVGAYPHDPVKPGEEGTIAVTFDSTHKKGMQNKSITILANTQPNRTVLRIKANVVMPERN